MISPTYSWPGTITWLRSRFAYGPPNLRDISTTALPDEVIRRTTDAGFKVAPTGIEHGTVTVVAVEVACRASPALNCPPWMIDCVKARYSFSIAALPVSPSAAAAASFR